MTVWSLLAAYKILHFEQQIDKIIPENEIVLVVSHLRNRCIYNAMSQK